MALMKVKSYPNKMNKNNLMKVFIFLSAFFILITPLVYSDINQILEANTGTYTPPSETIIPESAPSSPAEITKPKEFPEGYLDLINKKEKTTKDLDTIKKIEKENNLGCVTIGDVKIPLNTETHDGNIGATIGTYELNGGLDLNPFKTLTSKSGKVLDVSRAEDIEKIIIKDGEIAEIVFSKIDESNENLNEVLYASGEGKGLWFSPSTPEEGESEETNIQINEFGEGTISIKATAGINIDISGKENSEIIAKTDLEMNVEPLEKDSNYIEGTHLTVIKGSISVDGKEENLKITLLPNKEDEPEVTIIEEHEDQIGMKLIEISSIGKEPTEKNIYMNCDEGKIGDDEDKIIYSFGDIKEGVEETKTQIDATQSSGVEITTAIEGGSEVTAKCEEDKTVKISTWDLIKNAANKAISDINYFFKPGEYDVGEEKPQTTISFPFTQPTSSEGGGGGGVGVIDSTEEIIKIDIGISGSIKAGIGATTEKTIQIDDKVTIEEGDKLDSMLGEKLEEKPLPTLEEDIDEIIAALKEGKIEIPNEDSETFALWVEENKEWLVEEGLDLPSEELEAKYKEWVDKNKQEEEIAKLSGYEEYDLLISYNPLEIDQGLTSDQLLLKYGKPIERIDVEPDDNAKKILEIAYENLGKNMGPDCYEAVINIYKEAGFTEYPLTVYVNLKGEEDDRAVNIYGDQRDYLAAADLIEYRPEGYEYGEGHNAIFEKWVDIDKCIASVIHQPGDESTKLERAERYLCGYQHPTIVKEPVAVS